jgi:hypothetical protein
VKSPDALTKTELGSEVNKLADKRVADADADAEALQFSGGGEQGPGAMAITSATHDEVESAAPGVFAKDDYQSGVVVPSTTNSTSAFDKAFEDLKSGFMSLTTSDMNLAVAGSVRQALVVVDELQALSTVLGSEAAKISIAAAAGLLSPPSRADISSLRADAQLTRDEMSRAESELRSGETRRRAARTRQGLLENNRQDLVEKPSDLGQRHGRVLEQASPGVSGSGEDAPSGVAVELFAPQQASSPGLALEASRQSVADEGLSDSSAALRGSVLDKISYLAICQALASLDTGNETRAKAVRAYARLQEIVAVISKTLSPDFNANLVASVHELLADGVAALGSELQKRLDAIDTFLSVATRPLPTFVSTVENIGDAASNVSLVESLLADCGLRMDSFCDFQGMLEVAKSLDSLMAFAPQRPPRLGRVCFTLQAPDPVSDYQPLITRPDREAKLQLVAYVPAGASQIQARFPRSDVTRALTTPVPQVYGTLPSLVSPGTETLTVSGLSSTPSAVGRLRLDPGGPNDETLRYESFSGSHVFTLIDKPAVTHGIGESVAVDGEHRDQFTDVYRQREEIGGGPGKLRLAGDDEDAETLSYSGSTFNPATGVYTFNLSQNTVNEHWPQASGRPSPGAKKILFRDSVNSLSPAPRFNVSGAVITPVTPGSPPDMTTEIQAGDKLVLSDDVNDTPVTVQSVNSTSATLTASYHNQPVSGVSLAKFDGRTAPSSSLVYARLSQRAADELGINLSLLTSQDIEDFKLLVDQDTGTRVIRRSDGVLTSTGATVNTVSTSAPIFESGDVGKSISVQSRSGKRQVTGVITSVSIDGKQADFDSTTMLTGSGATPFSQSGATFTAAGGRLLSELQVGDCIGFGGVKRRVVSVDSNNSATVDPSGAVAASATAAITATDGLAPAVTGRQFSFLRQPRETAVVGTVIKTGEIWQLNTLSPLASGHGTQDLVVDATVQILPQAQSDFVSQPTSVTPRFEPDVVPPGTLTLRGSFQDPAQAPILGPLLAAGGGDVEIAGLTMPYTSLSVSGDDVTVTLGAPGALKALQAGETFCVPTSSTIESLLLTDAFPDGVWNLPFESWLSDIDNQLLQLHRRLCRLLQGRPEDVALIAAAMAASQGVFASSLSVLRILLQALLAGLGDTAQVDVLINQARGLGMDRAADAMAGGDVTLVAQMSAGEATGSGALLKSVVAYREKLTTYDQAIQADSLAAELRGSENSVRILAETRAGFKTAAADDISRKRSAAAALKAKAEDVTR